MKVSFVIPTIGRPAELQRFIVHLQQQEGGHVDLCETELIVVDQSGQAETGELLARLDTPFRIRHLPMAGRGAARARNYGWSFAQGEILSFPDDDCYYPPCLMDEVMEHFDDSRVDALMVQVEHVGR